MKKGRLICFVIVLALCVALLAACNTTGFDVETLHVVLSNLEREMLATIVTPESYTLDCTVDTLDESGKNATVYILWTVEEDSGRINPQKGDDQTVTIVIPDVREEDISYKLRAELVDANGKAYMDNGTPLTAVSNRVAPKTSGGGTTPTPGGDVGGDTTHSGTLNDPYTVADALAVIQSLPQGGQSTQLSYVQGKITGAIKTGDGGDLLFTITDDGTGDGITVWYAPAVQCQTGDTVVVCGYLWNFHNNKDGTSTAEIANNADGVGLAIVKVNGDAPEQGGDVGGDEGTPSTDWTDHVGTYTLYFADEEYYYTDMPITVNIQADKIIITDDNGSTEITEIEYYTDAVYGNYVSDDFYFTWNDEECILSIYQDDGSVELYGDTFTYVSDSEGGGGDVGGDVGTPSDDWSAYVGEVYELISFDEDGSQDTITVAINAASIVVTHGNDVQTISSDIEYYTEATDSYGYVLDWFGFIWNGKACYLDIYREDGFVQFYDEDDTIYYYVQTSGGDVGGGTDLDDVESNGTLSTDWTDHYGTYDLVAYDTNSENYDYIPDDTVQINIDASGITITQNGKTNSIAPANFKYFVGETDYYEDVLDCFYFMWNGELCFVDFYEDGYIDFADYDYTFAYDNEYEGDIGGGGDVGGEIVPGSTIKIEFSAQKFSNEQAIKSFTASGLTFTFTDGATPTKWFDNGTAIRVYGGGSMTVSGAKMVKIELILSSGGNSNTITTNVGNFSGTVWTGSADSVTFGIGDTKGHRRIAGVNVTFAGGGEQGGGETDPDVGTEVPEGATLFDFVQNFDVYAADWNVGGTAYVERKVTSAQLGISGTVEFLFSRASKQGGSNPITDRPVMASKNDDQYLTVSVTGQTISAVTFNLKEWIPGGNSNIYKTFTKVQIEYQIGDGAWTVVSGVGFSGEAQRITAYQTLSSGTLPEGVTSVRLVINGGNENSNQQVGVSSVALTLA